MIVTDGDTVSIGVHFLRFDLTDYFGLCYLFSAFSRNFFGTYYKEGASVSNVLVSASVVFANDLAETPKFIGVWLVLYLIISRVAAELTVFERGAGGFV